MRLLLIALSAAAVASGAAADMKAPLPLAGVWSFDGTCASGDGMVLKNDGKASYDEWGQGLWASADQGKRIVLIVEDIAEEADRRKVAELVEFRVEARGNKTMTLVRVGDGVGIKAVRCAER